MKNSTASVMDAIRKPRRMKGFHYDSKTLHGWELNRPPKDGKFHWVLTDDGVPCILSPDNLLTKWSVMGTQIVCHHMQEVTDEDFETRNPPRPPEGIELVWED